MALVASSCFALFLAALFLVAGNASAAQVVQVRESSSRTELQASAFARGAKPPATAKLKSCRSSQFYDGRRIVFSGRMTTFTDTPGDGQVLQMRFDVFRKHNEQRTFKKLKGTSLGKWLPAGDPQASIYIRELALQGIETSARYKAKVSFRWLSSSGRVEWRRSRVTKPCHQRVGLAQLDISQSKRVPIAGSDRESYLLSIYNSGASEAVNVPVFVSVDDGPAVGTIISSIGPGATADFSIDGGVCKGKYAVAIDPSRTLRLAKPFGGWAPTTCPSDPTGR